MAYQIQSISGAILFDSPEATTCKDVVQAAVKNGAYLGGADLRGAYLGGADLGGADLRGAYLGGAYLGGAYLGGAYLGEAYLGGAYLGGTHLRGAYLGGAYLGGADLRGADLGGAYFGEQWIIQGQVRSDGYAFFLQHLTSDTEPMIKAGCRYFTIVQAQEHWERTRAGQSLLAETRAIIRAMVDTMHIRGLK